MGETSWWGKGWLTKFDKNAHFRDLRLETQEARGLEERSEEKVVKKR